MMRRCADCTHWSDPYVYANGLGCCHKIVHDGSEVAFLTDPASLLTKPDFFCALFEAKMP